MKHVYEWIPEEEEEEEEEEEGGWRRTNLFPNNFQCSAVQRGWPAGIMYTRGLAGLSSRGTVRRAKGRRESPSSISEKERNDRAVERASELASDREKKRTTFGCW